MKKLGLSAVEEATEYKKVVAGGYICGITSVEDVPMNAKTGKGDYLKLEIDIAEGEFKNYFRELYTSKNFWALNLIKSYKETALSFFKAFITSVKNSNKGFTWSDDGENDEKTLNRKLIGCVLGEEEYIAKDGTIKTKLVVTDVHSVDTIRKGEFKVPPLKKLVGSTSSNSSTSNNTPQGYEEILSSDGVPF